MGEKENTQLLLEVRNSLQERLEGLKMEINDSAQKLFLSASYPWSLHRKVAVTLKKKAQNQKLLMIMMICLSSFITLAEVK